LRRLSCQIHRNYSATDEREVGADSFAQVLWPEIRLAVAILLAVMLVGWVRRTGLTAWPKASALLLTLPYVAFCVFVIFSPLLINGAGLEDVTLSGSDWQSVWTTCIVAVLVGFFEEVLFRGVVLQSLMTRMNGALAVIAAAIVFGLFHYVNWVSGQPLDVTTMQVLGAMAGGLLFGALVLWTGSLWPSILLHGLWDASVSISQTLQLRVSPTGEVAEIAFNPFSVLTSALGRRAQMNPVASVSFRRADHEWPVRVTPPFAAGTPHLGISVRFGQHHSQHHRRCHHRFSDCRCARGIDQRSWHIWPAIDHRHDREVFDIVEQRTGERDGNAKVDKSSVGLCVRPNQHTVLLTVSASKAG
jgi:membrane protease YdiL (CAAX protease family)